MALQIAVDLGAQGYKVLYLALEQSPAELRNRVDRLILPARWEGATQGEAPHSDSRKVVRDLRDLRQVARSREREEELRDRQTKERDLVYDHLYMDSSASGMEALPDFLTRQVLGHGPYEGTNLLVVDSIQALGTAPTSSKPYQRLFEFNRWAKEHGIATLLIGQVTKGGAIAGPRSLAHNVDCVLCLRKAMRLRPLFVPKNRFGPERHEPLTLITNKFGCLEKSRHLRPKASVAYGFLHDELIEVQALVKLPEFGERAGIKAPYLPREKLRQLVGIISSIRDIDMSDLTFGINCAIPGGRGYRSVLDLPLAVSMLASYFQRGIPAGSLFYGELDLFQNVRPMEEAEMNRLADLLVDRGQRVRSVYLSSASSEGFTKALSERGLDVSISPVASIEDVIARLWPDVVG